MNNPTIEDLQKLVHAARGMHGFLNENVIIAGGAPRDILMGRPIKDIDMFVGPHHLRDADYFGPDNEFATLAKKFAAFLGRVGEPTDNDDYPNFFDLVNLTGNASEKAGFKTSSYNIDFPIQIVGCHVDVIDDVMNYDFSISQVFVTPNGLFMSDQCGKDMRDRIIRYTPEGYRPAAFERSRKRLWRLRQKYPDWHYVDCEALDSWTNPLTGEREFQSQLPLDDDELLS